VLKDTRGSLPAILIFGMMGFLFSIYLSSVIKESLFSITQMRVQEVLRVSGTNLLKFAMDSAEGQLPSCSTAYAWSDLLDMQKTDPTEKIITDLNGIRKCLANKESLKGLSSVAMSASPIIGSEYLGHRIIKFSYIAVADNSISAIAGLKNTETKTVDYHISTLADFALVFKNENAVPMIDYGLSKVTVYGSTFLNVKTSVNINTIAEPSIFKSPGQLRFTEEVMTPASELTGVPFSSNFVSLFRQSFEYGIKVAQMVDFQLPFEINKPSAWEQMIDYHYVYNSQRGYPLPASINSAMGTNDRLVSLVSANVLTFPDPNVMGELNDTCLSTGVPSLGNSKPMILYRNKSTVTLNMLDSSNHLFCGMITANKLVINTGDNDEVLLVGSFWVNQLQILGGGKVTFFNPLNAKRSPDNLINLFGLNFVGVVEQLAAERASIAFNFFIPLFSKSVDVSSDFPDFYPKEISSFFEPCDPASSNWCWTTTIDAVKWDLLYTSPSWYKKIYFMRDIGI
jgi:hypothetical protein